MKAKKISKIFDKYTHVEELEIKQKGKIITRERVVRPNAVCAVVYDTLKQKYIFVKQYRPGCDYIMLELVAGKIDPGEDPKTAIIREIGEEIGYKVDDIRELVPFFYASPGYSTEQLIIYSADVSEKISNGGGVDDEDITIEEYDPNDIPTLLKSGKINDGKTLIGLLAETY